MERKRDGFVSVGDLALDLPDVQVPARRERTPQARHHFTQLDQMTQLVGASEADADLGFMARLLALCSLPRTNPGNRLQFKRVNGPYKLIMTATGDAKLPYGNLPRLLLAWVCTEAVRTQNRELVLGRSLSEFMRKVDIYTTSGSTHTRLRNQMKRLFHSQVELIYKDAHGERFIASRVADRGEFWWDTKHPNQSSLWESTIRIGEDFFNEIIAHPIPPQHEHPAIAQAMRLGPRPLPVAHLSHVRAQGSAAALLAAALPAVRRGPGQGERFKYRERLSYEVPPGVEEDQDFLAGPTLPDGSRGADSRTLDTRDPPNDQPTPPRGIALKRLVAALCGAFTARPAKFPAVCRLTAPRRATQRSADGISTNLVTLWSFTRPNRYIQNGLISTKPVHRGGQTFDQTGTCTSSKSK